MSGEQGKINSARQDHPLIPAGATGENYHACELSCTCTVDGWSLLGTLVVTHRGCRDAFWRLYWRKPSSAL